MLDKLLLQDWSQSKTFRLVKWLVLLTTYSYLVFKLFEFAHSDAINGLSGLNFNFIFLFLVLLLLPVNLLLEARKWQILLRKIEKFSLRTALKSILAGMISGFATPNRVGDLAGRLLHLQAKNRKAGIITAVISSLTNNAAILTLGIPAAYFFYEYQHAPSPITTKYWITISFLLLLIILILSIFPYLLKKRLGKWISVNESDYQIAESGIVLKGYLFSVLRICIFSLQFYLMLRFFDINLPLLFAIIAIPLMYLFITFTPSMSISEAGIRGSYAVYFIGFQSENTLAIICTGIGLWIINVVLPILIGTKEFLKTK